MSCVITKIKISIKYSFKISFWKVRKRKIRNQINPINENDSVRIAFPNWCKGFKGIHIINQKKIIKKFERLKTFDISFEK